MASSSNAAGIAFGDTTVVWPTGDHKATVVWLHDMGQTGADAARFAASLNLPNIKWICPTAPIRPVTGLGGAQTTAWFDVGEVSVDMQDDLVNINLIGAFIVNILSSETAHVKKGLGGHGLGAAQALYLAGTYTSGVTMNTSLVIAINGWLPALRNFRYHAASNTAGSNYLPSLAGTLPILLTNGNSDNDLVPYQFGHQCAHSLLMAGFPITFNTYNGTNEIVRDWLTTYLQL